MTPRERLLEYLGDLRDPDVPRPLVSLEEFFIGNDDPLSVGENGEFETQELSRHELYRLLRELRDHPATHDVRVEIGAPRTPDGWPTADTFWLVTRLAREEIFWKCLNTKEWCCGYLPLDWLSYPRKDGRKMEPLTLPLDAVAYGMWYM